MGDDEKRWESWLFATHSEAELRRWARRLGLFRFVRASGGHANDADRLLAAFRYDTEEELLGFLRFLGLAVRVFEAEPPQPVRGVKYRWAEYDAFPSLVHGTAWVEQPGHSVVAGRSAFVWAERGRVTISPHAKGDWDVEARHVEDAEAIEVLLADSPLPVVDPPVERRHCLCPAYHPGWFAQG